MKQLSFQPNVPSHTLDSPAGWKSHSFHTLTADSLDNNRPPWKLYRRSPRAAVTISGLSQCGGTHHWQPFYLELEHTAGRTEWWPCFKHWWPDLAHFLKLLPAAPVMFSLRRHNYQGNVIHLGFGMCVFIYAWVISPRTLLHPSVLIFCISEIGLDGFSIYLEQKFWSQHILYFEHFRAIISKVCFFLPIYLYICILIQSS